MPYYLKETYTSCGRGSNNKLTIKERLVIYFLSALPMIIAFLMHKYNL